MSAASHPTRDTPRAADLLILDCDGVIVDSEGPVRAVLADYFSARGVPITADEIYTLFTGGTLRSAGAEAARRGAILEDDWFDTLLEATFVELRKGVALIPGIVDLIDRAEAAGMAIAVASNGAMQKMAITLAPSGLFDRLHGRLYSGYTHGAPKPAPDLLLLAARDADVSPGRSVMVDDSPAGCRAAANAGIRCFGFATEGQDARLAETGAEVVNDIGQIAAALGL